MFVGVLLGVFILGLIGVVRNLLMLGLENRFCWLLVVSFPGWVIALWFACLCDQL